jgi:excinuclease ABC subunit C
VQASPRPPAGALPLAPGVYRFRDAAGRVLYLGRATHLRRRVASYWGDLGGRAHLAPMVARIARIEAVVCASPHEAAWLERNLLQRSLPPWNRSRSGGQESEVWIRLSESARAPGLAVVYQPGTQARHFGPYLGGAKVRDAVSGLGRVLPLGYAGDGMAGSERDMARVRGTSPAERSRLAERAAAVLGRDPDAVAWARAGLTARRDAAAARLAFEFAARLQAELEALDWIAGEQRVAGAEPRDAGVHGWAGGILVSFEIRDGRLSGWRQRPCGIEAARPRLAVTPPAWAGFAAVNAELASSLCIHNEAGIAR